MLTSHTEKAAKARKLSMTTKSEKLSAFIASLSMTK